MKKLLFVAFGSFLLSYLVLLLLSTDTIPNNIGNSALKTSKHIAREKPYGVNEKAERKPVLSYVDDADVDEERDPQEWQGMPPQKIKPYCNGDSSCGLAMACIDNQCSACRESADCASGESCVLQHCVAEDKVECTTLRDCDSDALCVLSGYSFGIRGNQNMRAFCRASSGGDPQIEDLEEAKRFQEASGPFEEPNLKISTLFEGLVYE